MKLFYKTSLILVSFTVVLILTISLFVFESQKESFKTLLLDESATTVHQKAIHMEKFIDEKRSEVQLLSVLPEMNPNLLYSIPKTNQITLDSSFKRVLETNPDINHIGILNLDGKELVGYNSIDGKAVKVKQENLQDKSDRSYFIKSKSTDSIHVTNIELSEEHKFVEPPYKKLIRITSPVKNNFDETVAFLVVNYDTTDILNEISELEIGQTVIFDHNGNFLLHPDSSREFGDQLGTHANYFEDEPELAKNVQLYDSKKHIDPEASEFRIWEKVFYDLDDSSKFWVISSVIPDSILYGQVQDLQNDMILVLSLSILGTIFVTILISKHITHPLKEMLGVVSRIEKGDLDVKIKKVHSDEIGDLVDSVNQMTQSLKQSKILVDEYQNEIESNLREVSVLNRALDKTLMVSKTDKHGNITYVNDKFCAVSKYSKEELLGKNHRIIKGNHPDSLYKNLWNTITDGKTWTGEIKNKAKDGSYFWVYQAITPNLDSNGNPIEYVSLKVDITKRKQAEEQLLQALNHLKEINLSKDEFSAMISHELKTPLTPIITYCDILKESSYQTDLEKECIYEIESNAKKLNLLISDVLDAQKLEMNKFRFNYSTFSVPILVENAIKDLKPSADAKNIKIIMGEVSDMMLTSDELRITQVLENLVKNSLDFVPKNSGIIEVGATLEDDIIQFHVNDNGMGIPKDKISYLFKKFYQLESGVRRSHGGTGLGLVICKGIVEGLGGKIWVTSSVGKGTTFFFTIPTKQTLVRIQNGSK